jgi:hypothetical protein
MSGDDVNGKLDTVLEEICVTNERLENIETLLVGEVKDSGKVGLLERIRQVEKWIAKREWFEKLVVAAIVGEAIGLVFAIGLILLLP